MSGTSGTSVVLSIIVCRFIDNGRGTGQETQNDVTKPETMFAQLAIVIMRL